MGQSQTVHLADDDEDDRMLIKDALEEANPDITVIEAENGQELIENIKNSDDLSDTVAVIDMNMPRMNGLETVARLKSENATADIPAVILSTSNNPETIKRAKAVGADEYFVKPNSFRGLVDIAVKIFRRFLGKR